MRAFRRPEAFRFAYFTRDAHTAASASARYAAFDGGAACSLHTPEMLRCPRLLADARAYMLQKEVQKRGGGAGAV